MPASTVLIFFLVGVVLSILIGNKLKFNIGLIATLFAYLIGVFGMGMKTSAVIGLWPTKILFTIIGICWLFGYANENGKQKQTVLLILLLVVLMVVPSLLGTLGMKSIGAFAKMLDISLVCMFLACVAAVLRLADDKVVVTRHIPWNTIMMLGGVSMLVGVATEGGAVDLIGTWIGSNVSLALITPMFVLLAAFMSVFVAGASVVTPTLFALVPAVAAVSGADYFAIYHGIAIGANASAVSPFSGGGSLTLANIKEDDIRDKMFLPLIASAAGLSVLAALLGALGLY